MEFALLYKAFTISIQDKYTKSIRGIQGCHLWRISKDYEKLAYLFPSTKDVGHYSHILANHTLIPIHVV